MAYGYLRPASDLWFPIARMNPQALVYSPSPKIGEAISAIAVKRGLAPLAVNGVGAVLRVLHSRKFPAIILDCGAESAASDLLAVCRNSRSNSSSMVIAIVDENPITAARGANLWVKRSADLRELTSALRSMEGIILREFHRYRRSPITSSVLLNNDEHSLTVQTVNISEGGMCVSSEIPGWNREHFVHFNDPEIGFQFKMKSIVVWKANGKSGIQFRFASENGRVALSQWLQAARL